MMNTMRSISKKIPSLKGNVASVIHFPQIETDKLAILCPGYLDTKDYTHLVTLANALCAQGIVVARFDPIGTWQSEGDISEYTITQYLEDIRYVLAYMLQQHTFRTIMVGGHSRGGQVALLYAARDPRIGIVLGIMPSSGPITGTRREQWERSQVQISYRDLPNKKNQTKEFRVPFDHVIDRDQYNVVYDAQNIKASVVLVAGALDQTVPSDRVKQIFDSVRGAKKFLVLENIGHDYRLNDSEITIVNEKIIEHLMPFF